MTVPTRRTVADIAAPYANFLTPMPYVEAGVCAICRCGVVGYDRCYRCAREPLGVGRGGADAVAMIALAPSQGQLSYELVNYKRAATSATSRRRFTVGLAALLWTWLARHEECVAAAVGVPSFPILATVPSSSSGRRGAHPLVDVVAGIVVGSGTRYRDLIAPSDTPVGQRAFSSARFRCGTPLRGEPVLLIDDTWTTGAHAHGAATALKAAGAGPVAVVAIGRWYHAGKTENSAVDLQLRSRRWSWDECMLDR